MDRKKYFTIDPLTHAKNIFRVALFGILLSYLIRIGLLFGNRHDFSAYKMDVLRAFLTGWIFDSSMLLYALVPLMLLPPLLSLRCSHIDTARRIYKRSFGLILAILIAVFIFASVSEFFFWEEFQNRFNFIAVDYLVYTQEVILNIWESYPMLWIFAGVGVLSLGLAIIARRWILFQENRGFYGLETLKILLGFSLLSALNISFSPSNLEQWIAHPMSQEIAKNGIFSLFHAYFANELEYQKFYATLGDEDAFQELKSHYPLSEKTIADRTRFTRQISAKADFSHYNVVLVSMESMSSAFMGAFGNADHNTPNLDRLAAEGISFTNIMATGTRTVRGLEALMLSVPPTPGQSILRRPKNDNLYNLADYLEDIGYEAEFLYGGYSYFDNMKDFFSGNGLQVWDRENIDKSETTFANAWGVCDEDLYDLSLRRADALTTQKKSFFQIIMTTSNHRPYTYPDNKIDIPSGDGRGGAIRYSDFAVGRFMEKAAKKSWFHNTLFVFVADHDASVSGYSKVPVHDFRIPLIFYKPNSLKAQKITRLGSQMDVAPSILSLMNMGYDSHFFGRDLFKPGEERAFLGNYQSVGMLKDGVLTLLSPQRKVEQFAIGADDKQVPLATSRPDLLRQTISYYQTASFLFSHGLMKDIGDDKVRMPAGRRR